MKKCSKCKIEKELDEFYGKKTKHYLCKLCDDEYSKNWRENNPEKVKEYDIKWRENNQEKKKLSDKNWRENNPEKVKAYQVYIKESGKKKEYDERYNNKPENKIRKKETNKAYWRSDGYKKKRNSSYKHAWKQLLGGTLRRLGKRKEGKTIELLGYSAIELKEHLESLFLPGMSWENRSEWHIDHKKPVSKFEPDTHPSIVNALSNLQPLWAEDNLKKFNKY